MSDYKLHKLEKELEDLRNKVSSLELLLSRVQASISPIGGHVHPMTLPAHQHTGMPPPLTCGSSCEFFRP